MGVSVGPGRFCATAHSRPAVAALRCVPMAARYYTHFVTSAEPAHSSEWSGVIELTHPLGERKDSKELRRLLAANFEIDAEDIKILQVARLH
jgi:hypothetical protein